jgi:hypothetical protein
VDALAPHCAVLLAILAYLGHGVGVISHDSYARGVAALSLAGPAPEPPQPAACGHNNIESALAAIRAAGPKACEVVVTACARTIVDDQMCGAREWLMLRAICDSLRVGMPSFVPAPFD